LNDCPQFNNSDAIAFKTTSRLYLGIDPDTAANYVRELHGNGVEKMKIWNDSFHPEMVKKFDSKKVVKK